MKKKDIKILLVDDEPDILEIVRYNLSSQGYQIIIGKKAEDDLIEFKEIGKDTRKINLKEIINIIKKEKEKN